jgi:hypothetical protein
VAVVVALATSACAAIEGLGKYSAGGGDGGTADGPNVADDATGRTDGPSGEGGVEDGQPSSDGPPPDVVVTVPDDAPAFDAGACGVTMVDLVHGVFVAPGGSDSAGCGTSPNSPCLSIGQGIMTTTIKADAAGRNIVYVAGGPVGGPPAAPYMEKLTLPAGVTVEGGWHWAGDGSSEWTFDCTGSPESVVTVQAPAADNMTVVANSNNGMSALSTLTILSKAAANVNAGETLYGIFATGANTQLTLTDVVVTMQQGGTGQAGTNGSDAGAPSSTCSSGDGNSMTTSGSVGTAGAGASVSSTGFATHTGGTGGNGTPGDNGTAGQAATPVSYPACVKAPPSCTSGQSMCSGSSGVNGCGGGAGLGGTGGGGGGSSIAVFAYDATVSITAGVLQAGNGGTGGVGGAGSVGAMGSQGSVGSQTICPQSTCASASVCNVTGMTTTAPGGMSGGQGGQGSNGGQGGGGAGGDSYAVLTGGMATGRLMLSSSTPPLLAAGQPGASGAPNGPAGAAAPNDSVP